MMTRPSAATARLHEAPCPDERLVELCRLIGWAAGAALRPEPAGESAVDKAHLLVPGWVLVGDIGESRLQAAAELIRLVHRGEQEIHSLCSEILERYEEATLVYRLSGRLGSVLGEKAITRAVLEDAARVLGARSGEVWLRDGDSLGLAAAVPEAPAGWDLWEQVQTVVLEEGRTWLQEANAGREAAVAVPLPGAETDPIGLLLLRGRLDGRSYRTGEVKLLMALASLTSSFIRNDRLAAKARQAEAKKREDEIARQIHRGLLPRRDPQFHGLDISGSCRAAEHIGGDYYGYISMPDGSLGLAMADISGHGVAAALYMAAAKGAFQSEARRVLSPADLLQRANEALSEDFSQSDVFATFFFARVHPGGRRIDYSNGGHSPPLLLRAGGSVEKLNRGGTALGILPDQVYEQETRRLAEGDLIVFYTDGVVEARNKQRQCYGLERLLEVVKGCRQESAARIRERILEHLMRHCGATPPQDDVTLVVIRVAGESDNKERQGVAV